MNPLRLFLHGLASMVYQFVIVKALAPYYGTSLHTWAITIAGFLLAFSLGGFMGGYLAKRQRLWRPWILSTAITFTIACVFGPVALDVFSALPFFIGLALSVSILGLFPVTMLSGLIPIHLSALRASPDVQSITYGWIGVGNIAGTLIAPFVMLPYWGLTLTSIGCALLVIVVCIFWFRKTCRELVPAILYALIAAPAAVYAFQPGPGQLLYSTHDAHGWVGVADRGRYRIVLHRYLHRNGAVESVIDRENPSEPQSFAREMFSMAETACGRPNRILQIGLGAGGINHYILKNHPESNLISVEINSTMLRIAREYFHLPEPPNHSVAIDDARHFVRASTNSYDWIILDAFLGSYPPDHMRTVEFYHLLAQHVSESGILMVNHVTLQPDHGRELAGILAAFPYVYRKPANAAQDVLIASKRPLPSLLHTDGSVRLVSSADSCFSDEFSIVPKGRRNGT